MKQAIYLFFFFLSVPLSHPTFAGELGYFPPQISFTLDLSDMEFICHEKALELKITNEIKLGQVNSIAGLTHMRFLTHGLYDPNTFPKDFKPVPINSVEECERQLAGLLGHIEEENGLEIKASSFGFLLSQNYPAPYLRTDYLQENLNISYNFPKFLGGSFQSTQKTIRTIDLRNQPQDPNANACTNEKCSF